MFQRCQQLKLTEVNECKALRVVHAIQFRGVQVFADFEGQGDLHLTDASYASYASDVRNHVPWPLEILDSPGRDRKRKLQPQTGTHVHSSHADMCTIL